MSDLMLSAVLNMPLPDDPSQMDALTWMQFRDRARQSADEIERLRAENERLRGALIDAVDMLSGATFEVMRVRGQYIDRKDVVCRARDALAKESGE